MEPSTTGKGYHTFDPAGIRVIDAMGERNMRTSEYHHLLGLTVAVLCCASHCIASMQDQYAIFDIAEGLDDGVGLCVNNSAVCGGFIQFDLSLNEAGIWTQRKGMRRLDFGTVIGSSVEDINNSNQAVGYYWPEHGWVSRAYLYDADGWIDLGTLGGEEAEANAISDSGVVVGWSYGPGGERRPFVYRDGVMRRLRTIENEEGKALDVNSNSVVVGSVNSGARGFLPCYWTPDGRQHWLRRLTDSRPGGHVFGLNDSNIMVGISPFPNGVNGHAVIWERGRVHDIHAWGGGMPSSSALAINNNNVVVGRKSNDNWEQAAFVWTQETGMILANLLLPPRSQWDLVDTVDINDLNMIVGTGSRAGEIFRPFLLTPVYPSIDLTDFSPGTSGQMSRIEVHNVQPGSTVYFLGSRGGGGTMIPGCDIATNALQLEHPQQLGQAVANQEGVAAIEGIIPARWAGQELLFQALIPSSCEISNLVVQRFE